ncbi:MAG: universal stress protein [Lewinellaceae bacterium]|nr:universal stress protein [Lewinellaceae bacterium]
MKNIIATTDFSDSAANALQYAAALASAAKARLVLYNAFPYPVVTDMPAEVMKDFVNQIAEEQFRKLHEIKNNLVREFNIEVSCLAQAGSVSADLEEIVQQEQADLVVMGLIGASPAVNVLMGSNTTAILRKGRIPLLIVPQSASFHTPRRILFACNDPLIRNAAMLQPLQAIASLFSADIEVLMISRKEPARKPFQDPRPSNLEEYFRNIKHRYTFEMSDSVREAILHAIQESQSDIIAMIPHHHAVWSYLFDKSDTLSVALQSSVPMLVLAENIAPASGKEA